MNFESLECLHTGEKAHKALPPLLFAWKCPWTSSTPVWNWFWRKSRFPFFWSGHLLSGVCPSPLFSGCPGSCSQTCKSRSSILLSSSFTSTHCKPASTLCDRDEPSWWYVLPHLSEHVVIQNMKAQHEGLLLTFYSKLQKMAGGALYPSSQSS